MSPQWKLYWDGKLDEVRLVLAHGDDVNDNGPFGTTALMLAVVKGHNSIVKINKSFTIELWPFKT